MTLPINKRKTPYRMEISLDAHTVEVIDTLRVALKLRHKGEVIIALTSPDHELRDKANTALLRLLK